MRTKTTEPSTRSPMTTQKLSQRMIPITAVCSITLLSTLAMTGCSTPNQRDRADQTDSEITQTYNPRARAMALELFREASQLHEDGKNEQALAKYRESIETDNTIFAAWNNMGQLLMQQKNYADAVAAFKVASDLQQTDPRPDYNIGLAYQTIGWGEESLTHFQISLDRDSNYLPSIRGVVRSAEMLGKGDQQILEFIRNGQLRETNQQWREYFDRQRFRVEKLIDETT
ncbi:MAG: tetratricopeptide repeat protein [Phycisphaerales bacterium]